MLCVAPSCHVSRTLFSSILLKTSSYLSATWLRSFYLLASLDPSTGLLLDPRLFQFNSSRTKFVFWKLFLTGRMCFTVPPVSDQRSSDAASLVNMSVTRVSHECHMSVT